MNNGFISQSLMFIKKNLWNILLLALILIILLIVMILNNISLNPNKNVERKLIGQLVVEGMEKKNVIKNC
jgi:hypothetical protein